MNTRHVSNRPWLVVLVGLLFAPATGPAWAHCDTLEGPVVQDARFALEQKDVTPVLKWIDAAHEQEIRDAFAKTLEVRTQSDAARELADRYFFETLVRVHRATEGFGFTGLKPISSVDPMIREADDALETGSADTLVTELTGQVQTELRKRFEDARQKRQHADDSVEAGRAYVAAYVRFVHFVEAIREATKAEVFHHAADHEAQPEHDEHR